MVENEFYGRNAAEKNKTAPKNIEGRELDGFKYDKSKAKVLKGALHSINVALGTLMSASKEISMIRGSEVTPDGKLGGKGFIMSFKEIKKVLNESVMNLSDVTDTIADELTNPMWGLSDQEKKKVKKDQEIIEDQVEEVEDLSDSEQPSDTPEEKDYDSFSEEDEVEDDASDNDTSEDETSEDVESIEEEIKKDYSPKESTDSYREMMSNDKTANVLSRRIMANLLTGMKKNG